MALSECCSEPQSHAINLLACLSLLLGNRSQPIELSPNQLRTVSVMSLEREKVTLPWMSSTSMAAGSSSMTRFHPNGIVTYKGEGAAKRSGDEAEESCMGSGRIGMSEPVRGMICLPQHAQQLESGPNDFTHHATLTLSPARGLPLGNRSASVQVSGSDQYRTPSRRSIASSGPLVQPSGGQILACAFKALGQARREGGDSVNMTDSMCCGQKCKS